MKTLTWRYSDPGTWCKQVTKQMEGTEHEEKTKRGRGVIKRRDE